MNYAQRAGVMLASSAAALLLAAIIFDRFSISVVSFPIAVIVFTLVALVAKPIVESLVKQHAREVYWGVGIATTYVTLLVTDLISNGIQVEGFFTWIASTALIWVALLGGDLIADTLGKSGGSKPAKRTI
jgi:putative membrane protein